MAALDTSMVDLKNRYHPFPSTCLRYKNKYIKIDFKNFNCNTYTHTYTTDDFHSAPDGVYVWIYAGIGDTLKFYFRQTIEFSEICTKHAGLLTILNEHPGPVQLHSAGELIKQDGSIRMNLMSGTFMTDVSLKQLYEAAEMLHQLISLPIKVDDDVKNTYITKDRVLHEYDDDFYRKLIEHGAIIKVYKTRNECYDDVDYKRHAVAMHEFNLAKRFKKPGDPEPVFVEPLPLHESLITTIEEFNAFSTRGGQTKRKRNRKSRKRM
jgi:hypothetical protein